MISPEIQCPHCGGFDYDCVDLEEIPNDDGELETSEVSWICNLCACEFYNTVKGSRAYDPIEYPPLG